MGFYGNITNTSNTTFVFDKIYPNRLSMDANVNNDGIFIGRYVLVEYQNTAAYPVVYIKGSKFYSSPNCEAVTQIKFLTGTRADNTDVDKDGYFDGVYENEIVQNYVNLKQNGNNITFDKIEYYKCTGGVGGFATFEKTTPANQSDYIKNFGIDEMHYSNEKSFKGYDSTVWTKASVESEGRLITKYVQIADLNSVVPTFDLETDAPTMKPLVPHFDADSTNVYYKLHTQPQWGLRVAEVESGKISDSTTNWISSTYNPATGQLIPSEDNGEHDAAIYFNKAAFLSQVDVNRKTTDGIDKKEEDSQEQNYFTINPTGTSHNQYYLHTALDENGNLQKIYGEANDIQEMRINLPAIGNMMSEAWDIIYGPKRDKARTDDNGSLQGRLDSFKVMEDNHIPIKRNDDGTIIGTAINGNNDYQMPNGKNILTTTHFPLTTNDPWINVTIDNSSLQGGYDKDNKIEISQEDNNAIRIRHSANSVDPTTTSWDKNDAENYTNNSYNYYEIDTNINGNQDEIKLYTPYVDATGHVVGKNIETVILPYGYKYFKTDGIVSEDEKGDLYSTNINTNGIKETKPSKAESDTQAHNTQDVLTINPHNKWIQTKIEDTENDGDILTIAHEIHSIDERYDSNTNLNDLSIDNENEEGNLTIYDWGYDEAGHINKKREHTYTLPYGFKYIKTNGLAKENNLDITNKDLDDPKTETATANSTQDTFNIDTVNKWIQVEVTDNDNRIKIAHELHEITENVTTDTTDDLNNQKNNQVQNTINIPDWNFDNAGHITHKSDRIYTLPYGYKTFTVSNSDTVGPHSVGNGALAARNTRDNLTFVTENNWIALEAVADNEAGNKIYIGHKTNGNSFGKTYYAKGIEPPENDAYKQEPKFGETANILNVIVDNAGHVTGFGTNTIKIPTGSLDDKASNGADVITQLAFDEPTGHLTSTRTNVGTLKLTGYSNDTTNLEDKTLQITSDDSINSGLKTIQNYINALDETDSDQGVSKYVSSVTQKDGKITVTHAGTNTLQLSNYTYIGNGTKDTQTVTNGQSINTALGTLEKRINDLDYADPDANTTQFVSKITENEGIINVERANVGGLVLTGYTASGKGSGEVGETDTVNSAFAKIENKINTFLKAADTSTNAIDTLKELQTYIEEHDVEATNIIKSINDEITRATNAENANTSLINQEVSRAQSKENEIVNNLNNEISRATEEEGKLNTRIDNLVGNTKVSTQIDNKINIFNSTLGSAAFTESSAYVDATTYANKIKELEDRIKELEDKLNPEPETPVEGE